jgi:putative ABC transport system permease protein
VPFTVVGVTPPAFFGTEVGRWFDIAVPIGTEPIMRGRASSLDQRASSWLNVMIRVKPGQSLASATAALRAVQPQVRDAAMPPEADSVQQAGFLNAPFSLTPAANGLSRLRGQYEGPLLTLFVIAALVLLIACANIANLLFARATTRQYELSVRVALGASQGQLVRLLFAESAVLAAAGAAAGLLLAPLDQPSSGQAIGHNNDPGRPGSVARVARARVRWLDQCRDDLAVRHRAGVSGCPCRAH